MYKSPGGHVLQSCLCTFPSVSVKMNLLLYYSTTQLNPPAVVTKECYIKWKNEFKPSGWLLDVVWEYTRGLTVNIVSLRIEETAHSDASLTDKLDRENENEALWRLFQVKGASMDVKRRSKQHCYYGPIRNSKRNYLDWVALWVSLFSTLEIVGKHFIKVPSCRTRELPLAMI